LFLDINCGPYIFINGVYGHSEGLAKDIEFAITSDEPNDMICPWEGFESGSRVGGNLKAAWVEARLKTHGQTW